MNEYIMQDKVKIQKNENRYVPQPLMELISKCDYKRKDDLYCVIDLIYRRQIYFRNDLQKQYGFCEIPRAVFQKLIPSPNNIKSAIDYLIALGCIIRNDFFLPNEQAKGYKIAQEYLGTKVGIEITDSRMNARLKKEKMAMRKKRVENLEFQKSKYYKTFKINAIEALEAAKIKATGEIVSLLKEINYSLSNEQINDIIKCTGDYLKQRNSILSHPEGKQLHSILHRLMIHQQQIHAIADGWLYFKRNKTNGRLDSNLTCLPTYLRKFITCDEELFNLDIKNSQPYFLYTKLRDEPTVDKSEVEQYGQLAISGNLYEYLGERYKVLTGKSKTREQIKKMLFSIFYSKITSFKSYKTFFRTVFPSIKDYIDTANNEKHNTLAVVMQTIESHAILDVVMPACKEVGIIPLTIHDSFIVSETEAPIIKQIFKKCFQDMFGLVPTLHYDSLFEANADSCEDDIFDFVTPYEFAEEDTNAILETIWL